MAQLPFTVVEFQTLQVTLEDEVLYFSEVVFEDPPAQNALLYDAALCTVLDTINDPRTPESAIAGLKETYEHICCLRLDYEDRLYKGKVEVRSPYAIGVRTLEEVLSTGTPMENIAYRYLQSVERLNEMIACRYSAFAG